MVCTLSLNGARAYIVRNCCNAAYCRDCDWLKNPVGARSADLYINVCNCGSWSFCYLKNSLMYSMFWVFLCSKLNIDLQNSF